MQAQNHPITQWAKTERPREKLLSTSPEHLSDSELIAILLHHGTRDKSAVDLAREVLLLGDNNLHELGRLSIKDFMNIKGIGEAKAITIAAALELGRRREANPIKEKKLVTESRDIAGFLKARLQDLSYEVFAVIFLNRANRIIHFEINQPWRHYRHCSRSQVV